MVSSQGEQPLRGDSNPPESPWKSLHQRAVQERSALQRGPVEGGMDLKVPAGHVLLHRPAHGRLEGIQLGRQVKVEVQPAVVHALDAEDQLTRGYGPAHPGKSGHASNAHRSTPAAAPRYWSSCSRW